MSLLFRYSFPGAVFTAKAWARVIPSYVTHWDLYNHSIRLNDWEELKALKVGHALHFAPLLARRRLLTDRDFQWQSISWLYCRTFSSLLLFFISSSGHEQALRGEPFDYSLLSHRLTSPPFLQVQYDDNLACRSLVPVQLEESHPDVDCIYCKYRCFD